MTTRELKELWCNDDNMTMEELIEVVKAEARAKTIEECKEVLEEYRGPVSYYMIDKINRSLEQLKEQKK